MLQEILFSYSLAGFGNAVSFKSIKDEHLNDIEKMPGISRAKFGTKY